MITLDRQPWSMLCNSLWISVSKLLLDIFSADTINVIQIEIENNIYFEPAFWTGWITKLWCKKIDLSISILLIFCLLGFQMSRYIPNVLQCLPCSKQPWLWRFWNIHILISHLYHTFICAVFILESEENRVWMCYDIRSLNRYIKYLLYITYATKK